MPVISTIGTSYNRHRPSIQENTDIQLPLIETNRPRVRVLFSNDLLLEIDGFI